MVDKVIRVIEANRAFRGFPLTMVTDYGRGNLSDEANATFRVIWLSYSPPVPAILKETARQGERFSRYEIRDRGDRSDDFFAGLAGQQRLGVTGLVVACVALKG